MDHDWENELASPEELDALEEVLLAFDEPDPLLDDPEKWLCVYCGEEFDYEDDFFEHEELCLQEQGWYGGDK